MFYSVFGHPFLCRDIEVFMRRDDILHVCILISTDLCPSRSHSSPLKEWSLQCVMSKWMDDYGMTWWLEMCEGMMTGYHNSLFTFYDYLRREVSVRNYLHRLTSVVDSFINVLISTLFDFGSGMTSSLGFLLLWLPCSLDYNLGLWAEVNPFSPGWCLSGFYHSTRKWDKDKSR